MARKVTGTLVPTKAGWCARVPGIVDGEKVKLWFPLGTHSKPAARIKLARIVAEVRAGRVPTPAAAERNESFAEACTRVHNLRVADGVKTAGDAIYRLRTYAVPDLGPLDVTKIETPLINQVLDACKAAGKSRQTVLHLYQDLSSVFGVLKREGAIKVSPVTDAEMPKFAKTVSKQRAVLTDRELAWYLAWVHPCEHLHGAVLERQTMSCVARLFGGLRTGDLHSMTWEALDTTAGRFEWGWAAREKTGKPQLLGIHEMLRPILRDWWERAGRPSKGALFPARRGKNIGQPKKKGSHADAFRRDLRRAFGLERWDEVKQAWEPTPGREPTQRERELFEDTRYTRPVDFHSWRRAFSQALADANVNDQQAMDLTGHATKAVYRGYAADPAKMRRLPEDAVPSVRLDNALVRSLPPIFKTPEKQAHKRRMGRLFRPTHS